MNKKLIVLMIATICVFGLVGCGGKKDDNWQDAGSLGEINMDNTFDELESAIVKGDTESESINESVKDENSSDILSDKISEETSEEDSKSNYKDTVENNVSEDVLLNVMYINEDKYTLPIKKDEIKLIKSFGYASASIDTREMYFVGDGWGINYNEASEKANAETIFFMMDENNENIIGVLSDDFWAKDDLDVTFVNGIAVGTSEDDVLAFLGEGHTYDDLVFYKNNSGIIAIEYGIDWDDGIKKVEEIYVFEN